MNCFSIVLCVAIPLFLLSCGNSGGGGAIGRPNGIITEIDPYWAVDRSGTDEEDGPTILNNPITTPSYPCPECTATSCPEDEPCDCPATTPPPADPITPETVELPELELRVITDFYYFPVNPPTKEQEFCLDISEADSLWWLAYQLTGGLIGYANIDTPEPTITTSAEGTTLHYRSTVEGVITPVLETIHYLSEPRLESGALVIDHDNITLIYHGLAYKDPVFGAVAITSGKVTCEGRSVYYPTTNKWYRNHTCGVVDGPANPVVFFFQAQPYYVNLMAGKVFRGEANVPENVSFSGYTVVNGTRDTLSSTLPHVVHACLGQ